MMRAVLANSPQAVVLVVVSTLWSCASTSPLAPPRPPRAQPAEATPSAPQKPSSIAEASAACDRVQANSKIPVSCHTEYIDDVPSMIVGFRNVDEANEWIAPFAEHVGDPFCNAANRNERLAWVYMVVGPPPQQQARRWSCELRKWGEWFAVEPNDSQPQPQSPSSVADAIQACQRIQADGAVPITCNTEYLNGVPTMIIGFSTPDDAERHMAAMAHDIAGPFCDAANRASRRAALFVTLANSFARHFDCEQQRWSEWFELPEQQQVLH